MSSKMPKQSSPRRTALLGGTAALWIAASAAGAQSLPGSPGLDYFPSWMHQDSPWVSGADQDRDPLPGERFSRSDADFQAWRAEQVRLYGTDYYKRPGYEEDYLNWREMRATTGGGAVTKDRDIVPERTLGR